MKNDPPSIWYFSITQFMRSKRSAWLSGVISDGETTCAFLYTKMKWCFVPSYGLMFSVRNHESVSFMIGFGWYFLKCSAQKGQTPSFSILAMSFFCSLVRAFSWRRPVLEDLPIYVIQQQGCRASLRPPRSRK